MSLTEKLSEAAEGVARNGQASERKRQNDVKRTGDWTEGLSACVKEIKKVQVKKPF